MARRRQPGPRSTTPHLGVSPVIDPTKNVLDLVSAAIARQDDLRDAEDRLVQARYEHQREVIALRAEHAKELREIEAKRLDAVHESDSLNARIVADRQSNTLDTLMRKMTEDREALRSLVESTARTLALENASKASAMEGRLLTLERSFSEKQGKEAVADPQMAALMSLVESLRDSRSTATGRGAGLSQGWAILMGALALLSALALLGPKIFGGP